MIVILSLAILGLADAGYLVVKARQKQAPVCPFGQSCDFVLQSRYNHVLGIKNEVLGFAFYVGVTFATLASFAGILVIPGWLWLLGFGGAFVAALILTGVQVFILRAYCSWCLASAAVNAALFVVGLIVFT